MYNEKIEALIKAALADGVLTEKEKQVLFKRAQEEGIDLDEFEMVLDARLVELQNAEKEKIEKSAPKSTKYGDVRKCPVCGALVPALAISCAECGYEFTGVDASSSAQILSSKIEEIKVTVSKRKNEIISSNKYSTKSTVTSSSPQSEAIYKIESDGEEQIKSLVNNYPIPNTKNDLFDLIMYLKQTGFKNKYKECLDRAKLLYPNDPMFLHIIAEDKKKQKKDLWRFIIIAVLFVIIPLSIHLIAKNNITRVENYIENGNLDEARKSLSSINFSIRKSLYENAEALKKKYDFSLQLIEGYIKSDQLDKAIDVYEKITPEHCSTYKMQYSKYCHGRNGKYEPTATSLIYKALIDSERMDDAIKYHPMEDYSGFTERDYYDHMREVINYYCRKNNKDAARKFVKEHLIWFKSDATKYNKLLIQQINNY